VISHTFSKSTFEGASSLMFTGRIWYLDSWDGEKITITITANSKVISTNTKTCRVLDDTANKLKCPSTGGWQDHYYDVTMNLDDRNKFKDKDIKITITNTLN